MKHVLGFSGGIDSQAAARWLLNRYPPADVILLNADPGGNEHPMTTEFIERYSSEVHPVVVVKPLVRDMGGACRESREALGIGDDEELTFDLLAKLKGVFPGLRRPFCTQSLKLAPSRRWLREHLSEHGIGYERYTGVRREESTHRRKRKPREFDDFFNCWLNHPIVDWSKQMCFDYVRLHGEPINPLYSLGFNRVGCAPCVNSSKQDIRNWAKRFPEMIDKVRAWEEETGLTFFPATKVRNGFYGPLKIDDIVKWSMTAHGGSLSRFAGNEDPLAVLPPPPCESDYGLCE